MELKVWDDIMESLDNPYCHMKTIDCLRKGVDNMPNNDDCCVKLGRVILERLILAWSDYTIMVNSVGYYWRLKWVMYRIITCMANNSYDDNFRYDVQILFNGSEDIDKVNIMIDNLIGV